MRGDQAVVKSDGSIPKVLNHDSFKALLEFHGWRRTAGGKHQTKMEKAGHRPITIPIKNRRDYGRGFRAQLLREAGLAAGETIENEASGE